MSALPSIITPTLLSAIKTHPNLPRHTWYFITATTLSVLNRPDELPKLYKYVLDYGADPISSAPSPDEQLKISRRLREALVKAGAIGGMPKSINSLLALKAVTPEHLLDEPSAYSPTSRRTEIYDVPSAEILSRGQTFFEKMYGKISKRVMGQMDRSGTEDLGLMARLVYSYILSNTNVLSSVETSFVLIAGLIPQDLNPQLKGHLRGALNGGATVAEVKAVREVVLQICEASGMTTIGHNVACGFGWRDQVADL